MLPNKSSAGMAALVSSAIRKARVETIVICVPSSGATSPEVNAVNVAKFHP
jgi:hypothetical protein